MSEDQFCEWLDILAPEKLPFRWKQEWGRLVEYFIAPVSEYGGGMMLEKAEFHAMRGIVGKMYDCAVIDDVPGVWCVK